MAMINPKALLAQSGKLDSHFFTVFWHSKKIKGGKEILSLKVLHTLKVPGKHRRRILDISAFISLADKLAVIHPGRVVSRAVLEKWGKAHHCELPFEDFIGYVKKEEIKYVGVDNKRKTGHDY